MFKKITEKQQHQKLKNKEISILIVLLLHVFAKGLLEREKFSL